MIVTLKAIVLNSVKYGDADLIVKCYTQDGLKSYLLKGILKSKKRKLKPAYFQPLCQLEITANHNPKRELHFIKEAKISYAYTTIFADIKKQTIIFFLSEVLTKSIREEEPNKRLFEFLESSFKWLDANENIANFHIVFLIELTKYLGFYPDKEHIDSFYFDLQEGSFSEMKPANNYIFGENLTHFKTLLGINFDGLQRLALNSISRQELLNTLIQYFELHLPGFYKPKSLTILKTVFE